MIIKNQAALFDAAIRQVLADRDAEVRTEPVIIYTGNNVKDLKTFSVLGAGTDTPNYFNLDLPRPRKPSTKKPRPMSEADHQALERAEAKRARKAAKRGKK